MSTDAALPAGITSRAEHLLCG